MKKLLLSLVLLITVAVACTTTQQTASYNTLYTLEQTTTTAYNAYFAMVVKGTIPTNSVPQVSQTFNKIQAGLTVALDAVQYNTNAIAPTNLVSEATDFITLITTIEGGK